MTKKLLSCPGGDQGEGSGAVGSKAEEGVDAERRRPTTTREAAAPGHSTPRRGRTTASRAISGPRRGVRTATAVGAVTLGLTALTACEKPTPLTTVTVGRTTVTAEAACYDEGKTIPEAEAAKCTEEKPKKTISIGDGDKLRIGVEPDMAETGWMVFAENEPLMQEPSKKTYHSFPSDSLFQQQDPSTGQPMPAKKSVTLRLILTEDGKFKGVWIVKAKRDA